MEMRHVEYNRITNCINCGAPLQGTKCGYCNTEYHLDDLGRLKDYHTVKLELFGKTMEFYINYITSTPNYEQFELVGCGRKIVQMGPPIVELNLVSTGRILEDD